MSYPKNHWSKRPEFADLPWSASQVKLFVREVRECCPAWDYWLVDQMKQALIAEKAFAVARTQHRDSVSVVAMDRLLEAMLIEAGLL